MSSSIVFASAIIMLSLQPLFEAISQTQDEQNLRSQILPQLKEYFAARRSGIFFFDQLPFVDARLQQAWPVGLSLDHNPVVRYLVEHHAPVHEGLVTSPKVWRMICPRLDHWHVMAGPIVSRAQLVGAVGCTRERSMPAFDAENLADLTAVCLHLSVWTATVRAGSPLCQTAATVRAGSPLSQTASKAERLTPRELQIAQLVALGRTNSAIGGELWITENSVKQALKRMFRKLEVSSRAELVARLTIS